MAEIQQVAVHETEGRYVTLDQLAEIAKVPKSWLYERSRKNALTKKLRYTPVNSPISGAKETIRTRTGRVPALEWLVREKVRIEAKGYACKIVAEDDGWVLMSAPVRVERPDHHRCLRRRKRHAEPMPESIPDAVFYQCVRCHTIYRHRVRWCAGYVTRKDAPPVACCHSSAQEADLRVVNYMQGGRVEW